MSSASEPIAATTSTTNKETVSSASSSTETEDTKKKPLLSSAAILRLLAELAKSYAAVARVIVDYVFDTSNLSLSARSYISVSFNIIIFYF